MLMIQFSSYQLILEKEILTAYNKRMFLYRIFTTGLHPSYRHSGASLMIDESTPSG